MDYFSVKNSILFGIAATILVAFCPFIHLNLSELPLIVSSGEALTDGTLYGMRVTGSLIDLPFAAAIVGVQAFIIGLIMLNGFMAIRYNGRYRLALLTFNCFLLCLVPTWLMFVVEGYLETEFGPIIEYSFAYGFPFLMLPISFFTIAISQLKTTVSRSNKGNLVLDSNIG